METIRTFVALELSKEVQTALARKQGELRALMGGTERAVRWARADGVHLTLQFLGDVPTDRIQAIAGALRAACVGARPLSLAPGAIGVFPNLNRPRVIWVGLEGDIEPLRKLQANIADKLKPLGYQPDKAFQPHITLGRMRETARREELDAISHALRQQETRLVTRTSFVARHVTLMKSELRPGGSVYTELDGIELG